MIADYDYDATPSPEVIKAWADACKCCPDCSPTICAGVSAGGSCDRTCWCALRDDYQIDLTGDDDGDE